MMRAHGVVPEVALDSRARRKAKQSRRADGVTIASAPGARKPFVWLVAAAALVLLAALIWSGPPRTAREPVATPPPVVARADAPPPAQPIRAAKPALRPVRALEPLVQDTGARAPLAPPSVPVPPAGDAPAGTLPSGIGLFPPPGTEPPKQGIIVPDGFELPEGYVRHYQVTDDGQELAPILMFHPDYDWVDELGNHQAVSPDGVVPPELAPEGLPIEMLELPEPEPGAAAPTP
jgi:hypothetical protein